MPEEKKLDVKDFRLLAEVHDEDRFLMTEAANAHFAAAMPFKDFRETVLQPIIESSRPGGMGCEILTSIDEYNALAELDPKTMYVIIEGGQIIQAFLGEYPFAVGGSGGGETGVPIEQVFVDLEAMVLELGEKKQLTATYEPSDATNTTLSWTTSNRLVATVSGGLVTSVGKGECIIKVRARSGAYAECMVTVEVTLVGLSFSSENNKLVRGYATQLEPVPVPANATLDLTYSSSDTSVATVDQSGVVTPVADTGQVTVTAVNKNGVRASVDMTLVPFAVSVSCQGVDPADNSVQSIFSVWKLAVKGGATHYKYTETVRTESGSESTLQGTDWAEIPADRTVRIELYAEFGYKYINWTFKNGDGSHEEQVTCPLVYKEPDLENRSFDLEFECGSAEEASAITLEIPYFKYDKDFFINERCDDGYRPLVCEGFRYCNREQTEKRVPLNWREGMTDPQVSSLAATEKFRSPRRLGYTDGCGTFINFVFDSCTMDFWQDSSGVWRKQWDPRYEGAPEHTCGYTGLNITRAAARKLCDYGGHILLHNMAVLPEDSLYYTPKYENDYTYTLQRDTALIEEEFGYTPNHFANPDGKGYYTYPCIKSPKTYMLSAGGEATKVFTDEWAGKYGKPAHRQVYDWTSDFSLVPLSEIRNCLIVNYSFFLDAPYRGNLWTFMFDKAVNGEGKRFKAELQHGIGNHEANYRYYDLIHDYAGADGLDNVMVASGDEFIEYMYYQRVARITKTVEGSTAKFNISFSVPGCFDFKTYSVKALHLPAGAIVRHSPEVTYFSKNLSTGLVNFGYNAKAAERAARYYQAYVDDPSPENLDKALYFTGLLGECNTYTLPRLDQVPSISRVDFDAAQSDLSRFKVTVENGNKEWGEAHTLEVSLHEDFHDYDSYRIVYRKFYDPSDPASLSYDFDIRLKAIFGEPTAYYFRYRNRFGVSNVVAQTVTFEAGEQFLEAFVDAYYCEPHARVKFTQANVLQVRCLVNGVATGYVDAWDGYLDIELSAGNNELVFEGTDNTGRTVTCSRSTTLYPKEWESRMFVYPEGGQYYQPSRVEETATGDGYSRLPNFWNAATPVCDTSKVQRGLVGFLPNSRVEVGGYSCDIASHLGKTRSTGDDSALYPDQYIDGCIFTANYNQVNGFDAGRNYRTGYKFSSLPAGKYIARLFIRNMLPNNRARGIAFVSTTPDSTDPAERYGYLSSREYDMAELYDNRQKTVDLPFEVTDASQLYFIGVDRRADLYGKTDGCDKYDVMMYPSLHGEGDQAAYEDTGGGLMKLHINLVHLVKVKE